jgi:hypothetical protein
MNDQTVIITKVPGKKAKAPKRASQLEKPVDNNLQDQTVKSTSQVVPSVLQPIGADGIGAVVLPDLVDANIGLPSKPQVPPVSVEPLVGVEKKTRRKSAKALAKEELIEAEKQLKVKQLEQEQEMRRKALDEIQKLEALKAQLLREEIQRQIELEAQGEIKRTRKTRQVATAEVEKKKATRKVTKQLMPDNIPSVGPSNPQADYYHQFQQPVLQTPAPVCQPPPAYQPPPQAPVVAPKQPVTQSNPFFRMKNGRLYF